MFSPAALDARLGQTLELPPGPRDAPERQRTLRATIEWSYRLLSESEQQLFCALGRFAGGARLDAIAAVHPDSGQELITTVSALVDKSLLRRSDDPDGQPRFWMLQTIREHAIAASQPDLVASRHAAHFAAQADQASPHLRTARQGEWLQRLDADFDNLRIALDHLTAVNPARSMRMAAALGRFWEARGHGEEGLERLRGILAIAANDSADAANAAVYAGRLAYRAGNPEDAAAFSGRQSGSRVPVANRSSRCWRSGFSQPSRGVVARHGEPWRCWNKRCMSREQQATITA